MPSTTKTLETTTIKKICYDCYSTKSASEAARLYGINPNDTTFRTKLQKLVVILNEGNEASDPYFFLAMYHENRMLETEQGAQFANKTYNDVVLSAPKKLEITEVKIICNDCFSSTSVYELYGYYNNSFEKDGCSSKVSVHVFKSQLNKLACSLNGGEVPNPYFYLATLHSNGSVKKYGNLTFNDALLLKVKKIDKTQIIDICKTCFLTNSINAAAIIYGMNASLFVSALEKLANKHSGRQIFDPYNYLGNLYVTGKMSVFGNEVYENYINKVNNFDIQQANFQSRIKRNIFGEQKHVVSSNDCAHPSVESVKDFESMVRFFNSLNNSQSIQPTVFSIEDDDLPTNPSKQQKIG